mgnify:CR=1 FL=1
MAIILERFIDRDINIYNIYLDVHYRHLLANNDQFGI